MFIYSAFADEISPSLDVQMSTLKRFGISYIEARGINGKNISLYTPREAGKIKKVLDDGGFRLSALGSPIGKIKITDSFDAELDRFKNILELAHIFETKYIRMFSFFMDAKDAPMHRDAVLERWRGYIEAAEGSGTVLLHENEKGIYGDSAERCLDLLTALSCRYVRATFDPANFVQCGEDTLKAFEMLKEHIEYMHIKDALWQTGEVVPAGHGSGNIKEILERLRRMGWSGFLSLEPHLGDFEGFADLEQGVKIKKEASGPEKFAAAYNALSKIVSGVESN